LLYPHGGAGIYAYGIVVAALSVPKQSHVTGAATRYSLAQNKLSACHLEIFPANTLQNADEKF